MALSFVEVYNNQQDEKESTENLEIIYNSYKHLLLREEILLDNQIKIEVFIQKINPLFLT